MGVVRVAPGRALRALVAGTVLALLPIAAGTASAAQGGLRADLDGIPIALVQVGSWYCHDFDYPAIHCFSDPDRLEAAVGSILGDSRRSAAGEPSAPFAATAINYVLVFEFTSYAGAYMYMSQDYTVLGTIGWNDRISSFWGLNNELGVFWTDWFYTGSRYAFCCNTHVPSLGSYDNSFSSVFRN